MGHRDRRNERDLHEERFERACRPNSSELERLGLLRLAEQAAGAGHERLFPDLRPNKYGRLGAKWGGVVEAATDATFAALRMRGWCFIAFATHFKQHARHVGMIEGVQRQNHGT